MTSQINPNNINGNYPVAGVPNNTQGFRDNFTNTKTNFEFAAAEISELQTKAVLKAGLGNALPDNNMADNLIYAAKIQDFSGTLVQLAATTGNIEIDYSAGHYQTINTTGSVSLSFVNFPTSGSVGMMRVRITVNNVAHTLTLPASVTLGTTGIQGFSGGVITFGAIGTYEFGFVTSNGGTNITIFDLNRPLSVYTNPVSMPRLSMNGAEDLADAAAANLLLATSYFSTSAAETATLAAGSAGQIKTFAMFADSGDMVITVTNAGWKTSGTGTITFAAIGDACTLQYINSKWFCIGNNGCTFA
jgi:hypothetical protein